MLNQFILVGRIAKEIEIVEENGKKKGIISLAIPRSFKNEEGVYDTDFVDCVAYGLIVENTKEYCRQGDIVGIKGRVQSTPMASGHAIEIVAEKVTFLSSKTEEKEEGENE